MHVQAGQRNFPAAWLYNGGRRNHVQYPRFSAIMHACVYILYICTCVYFSNEMFHQSAGLINISEVPQRYRTPSGKQHRAPAQESTHFFPQIKRLTARLLCSLSRLRRSSARFTCLQIIICPGRSSWPHRSASSSIFIRLSSSPKSANCNQITRCCYIV